jgi:hypothetical protein
LNRIDSEPGRWTGWWKPNRFGAWQAICESWSYDDTLALVLRITEGTGTVAVTPSGTEPEHWISEDARHWD